MSPLYDADHAAYISSIKFFNTEVSLEVVTPSHSQLTFLLISTVPLYLKVPSIESSLISSTVFNVDI